jgi:glutamine synthetase
MVGSNLNITGPNIVLNTIVAESLRQIADELENVNKDTFKETLNKLLVRLFNEHKRIIFNGNGYEDIWLEEAAKRKLPNIKSAADAIPYFESEKSIDLFTRHKVFTEIELHSRTEILLENYVKALNIEALTTIEIARRQIVPAVMKFEQELLALVISKKSAGIALKGEDKFAEYIGDLKSSLLSATDTLRETNDAAKEIADIKLQAKKYQDEVFPTMQNVRAIADTLETNMPVDLWPLPSYGDLLFSTR